MNTGSQVLYGLVAGVVSGIFLRSFFVIELEVLWFLGLMIAGLSVVARTRPVAKGHPSLIIS